MTSVKDYTKLNDEELMELLQDQNDTKAFNELVDRYKDKTFTYLNNSLKNVQDAEDALQECFLRLFRFRDTFQEISSFSTWFYAMVNNTLYTQYSIKEKNTMIYIVNLDDVDIENKQELLEINEYDDEEVRKRKRMYLERAVSMLENNYKDIIIMKYIHEMKIEEIAERLDIPEGTVNSRLNRGRERLYKYFVKIYKE